MLSLLLAELRAARWAWLGVSVSFLVANLALAVPLLVLGAVVRASGLPGIDAGIAVFSTAGMAGLNLTLALVVGAAVIGSATTLVVGSRRPAIAHLALAGATPGQVTALLLGQVAVVSLATALVADLAAAAALSWLLRQYATIRAAEGLDATPPATVDVGLLVGANLTGLLLAIGAGLWQAWRAGRIPALEALRVSRSAPPDATRRGRWLVGFLVATLLVGLFLAFAEAPATPAHTAVMNVLEQFGRPETLAALTGWLLACASPITIKHLTRAWTALIPTGAASWHLARHTVIARSDRLARSVVPVMFTIGVIVGIHASMLTGNEILRVNGVERTSEYVSLPNMLVMLGLACLIGVAGSVGNLLMMSRQRDAELALAGVAGATPGQRVAFLVLEGVIVTVTAALLAAAMVGVGIAFVVVGLTVLLPVAAVVFPFTEFAWVAGACLLIVMAAITLPSLPPLRQPPSRVVARLVAD